MKVLCAAWSGGGQCFLPGKVRGGTTLATVFRQPFSAQYLSDFVKTWPPDFRLAAGAARLQPVRCPKCRGFAVLGRYSWIAQGLP